MRNEVRLRFSKTGKAVYISHLDLVRCIQRAIRRAKLPIHYSEGFHPHMQTIFAAALSLGFESEYEILDLQLDEALVPEEVLERLQEKMPEGIRLLAAGIPTYKMNQLAYAEYLVKLNTCRNGTAPETIWLEFLEQPEILVEKKTKRGVRQLDLKLDIACLSYQRVGQELQLILRLPAGNSKNINPTLVMEAFIKMAQIEDYQLSVRRLRLLSEEKTEFF